MITSRPADSIVIAPVLNHVSRIRHFLASSSCTLYVQFGYYFFFPGLQRSYQRRAEVNFEL